MDPATLIADLASPHLSMTEVAERHGLTLDALVAFITPDQAAPTIDHVHVRQGSGKRLFDVVYSIDGLTLSDGAPWEFVRYSSYGEPTVYPVADVNRDGVVNYDDMTAFGMGSTTGDFAATPDGEPDLDFDGDIGSSADIALFMDSYDANTGQSGKGRMSSAEMGNRKGYAGYEWDHVIGMSHVRHRVYWAEIGRWTRRDPLGYVDGLSLYSYVRAQSIRLTDPLGLRSGSNYYSGQSEGIDREFYGNSDASSLGDPSDNSLLDAIEDVSGCMLQCMIGMTDNDIDNMMKDLINETPNTIIKEILLRQWDQLARSGLGKWVGMIQFVKTIQGRGFVGSAARKILKRGSKSFNTDAIYKLYMKNIVKKVTKDVAGKAARKIGGKFVPGAGWVFLGLDIYETSNCAAACVDGKYEDHEVPYIGFYESTQRFWGPVIGYLWSIT